MRAVVFFIFAFSVLEACSPSTSAPVPLAPLPQNISEAATICYSASLRDFAANQATQGAPEFLAGPLYYSALAVREVRKPAPFTMEAYNEFLNQDTNRNAYAESDVTGKVAQCAERFPASKLGNQVTLPATFLEETATCFYVPRVAATLVASLPKGDAIKEQAARIEHSLTPMTLAFMANGYKVVTAEDSQHLRDKILASALDVGNFANIVTACLTSSASSSAPSP